MRETVFLNRLYDRNETLKLNASIYETSGKKVERRNETTILESFISQEKQLISSRTATTKPNSSVLALFPDFSHNLPDLGIEAKVTGRVMLFYILWNGLLASSMIFLGYSIQDIITVFIFSLIFTGLFLLQGIGHDPDS